MPLLPLDPTATAAVQSKEEAGPVQGKMEINRRAGGVHTQMESWGGGKTQGDAAGRARGSNCEEESRLVGRKRLETDRG